MSHRILFLSLALLALSALAGAATLPVNPAAPAAVAPALTTAALPWLQPVASSTPEKPGVAQPGKAPLGAIFENACSQACLQDETACFNGCGGDQGCKQTCSDDYYCCLRFCTPNLPLCP
jgi:hypothetical protein